MWEIHRSSTTWLARRTERGSAARPPHCSHRRRLTLEPLEGRALLSLTTWTVNSLGDTGTGSGTSGDLRYVITQVDQTPGDNTINFTVTGTITLNSALPDLSNTTGSTDIEGPGASSLTGARNSAAGTADFGIFTVDSGVTASLTGLTISGGVSASGGGIFNAGTLTVDNSTIDNNTARSGGGIENDGTLTVTDSTIDHNSDTSGFSFGGGIVNGGTMTVTDSTITDNSAGVYPANGGGIWNGGTLTVTDSTITDNSASLSGGGIFVYSGTAILDNTIVALNTSGTGSGATPDDIVTFDNGVVSPSSAFNLIGTGGSGGLVNGTNGNQVGVADPGLDPNGLQNNGGPTQTIALVTGSPAIDAGSNALAVDPTTGQPLTTDQRGALRGPAGLNAGTTVDIGAYEASSSYLVTSTADTNDVGTLRAAVGWANVSTNANPANVASPAPNTVTFDTAGTFATPQTITLTQGTLELSNTATAESIVGTGAASLTVARSSAAGTPDFGIFAIDANANVKLVGLTITGGYVFNSASAGGGIYNAGTLAVTNCTIADNLSSGAFGGFGGGIGNGGTLTVTNSTIADNSAHDGYGGGISNGGTLTVTNSNITDNSGGSQGGGIFNGGTATVTNSTIAHNSATLNSTGGGGTGGGMYNYGRLTVTNSTIADNSGGSEGGGIFNVGTATLTNSTTANNSAPSGGGIFNIGGTLTLTNSTIANNSASEEGGGIDIEEFGGLTVTNSTIADNSAPLGGGIDNDSGTATLNNTIVALNTASDIVLEGGGTVSTSSAYNLIGTGGSGGLVNGVNGNQVGVANPGLGQLAYYGGPTQTIDLLPGSPAIGAGSNALAVDPSTGRPLTTDQRGAGFARITYGRVDIGAYQLQSLQNYVTAVDVGWGTQSAALQTAADGIRLLPAGRTTDLPWLGIDQLQINLAQSATLAASDVTVTSATGVNYGPVIVTGSGTSYTITLAQPIDAADRVSIAIVIPNVYTFMRRLDVLPGDVNDDGVVNVQDLVAIRNQMLGLVGAVPTIFGDILGDGTVDINDYTAVRELNGTTLPPIT